MRLATSGAALATTLILTAAAPDPVVEAMPWEVDENHTEVSFRVNHFFTPVSGKFEDFTIDLDYDRERPENSAVRVEIDVASINTNNERRDDHLMSGDFFEAERYPTITFESTSVRRSGEHGLVATGPLTIKGVTKTVELPIELLGVQEIPPQMQEMLGGATRVASFRTGLTLDRRDYGVGVGDWAATLVVGKDVDVEILLEAAERG